MAGRAGQLRARAQARMRESAHASTDTQAHIRVCVGGRTRVRIHMHRGMYAGDMDMNTCMEACAWAYMSPCMRTRTCMHMLYAYRRACTLIHNTCAGTRVHMRMHTYLRAHAHKHTHAHTPHACAQLPAGGHAAIEARTQPSRHMHSPGGVAQQGAVGAAARRAAAATSEPPGEVRTEPHHCQTPLR